MNRRTFVTGAVSALALSSQKVFGETAVSMISGTTFESVLTGAQIDLGRTGFDLMAHFMNDETGEEMVTFRMDPHFASVSFVPAGQEVEARLDQRMARIVEGSVQVEEIGIDVLDDGGWLAASSLGEDTTTFAIYSEFQVGAFPGYDLEVYFSSRPERFHEGFEIVQEVQLEGLEPFLFTQESSVSSLEYPVLTVGSSSRSQRGSGSSGSTRSTRSGQSGTGTTQEPMDEGEVVQAVRDHQAKFEDELDSFFDLIAALNEDQADEAEFITTLTTLMFEWMAYPSSAEELVFPSNLASLEAVYFEWADAVGEMGATMSAWILGGGDIEYFLDAIEAAQQINIALRAELRALGVVTQPSGRTMGRPDVRSLLDSGKLQSPGFVGG